MPVLFDRIRHLPTADESRGGTPFISLAPHNAFALVGLSLRVGAWIDRVAPVFAELLDDGTLGPEVIGAAHGGFGGEPVELRTAPGCVVAGYQVRTGTYVDAVRLLQMRWDGQLIVRDTQWTPWVGSTTSGIERIERFAEPLGQATTIGIAGRTGDYVDAITLVTADVHLVRLTDATHGKHRGAVTNLASG